MLVAFLLRLDGVKVNNRLGTYAKKQRQNMLSNKIFIYVDSLLFFAFFFSL